MMGNQARRTGAEPRDAQPRSTSDLVKFTALASLLAIFFDAAIGHAMLWGNDPYWTYWVTDTLLMATVFGLGTAWFGVGLWRGALITGIHITLLTTYYWTLSPIGLPSQPEWLDLEHTWLTGLPVHFAVYYLGYLVALWLWRRRSSATARELGPSEESLARVATIALATVVGIVVAVGLLQTLATGEFPGVTWFIVRIAIAFPFTLAWWRMAGAGGAAVILGGIMLGFLLATYGHFLAPIGLPDPSLRLLAEDPPPAGVQWLSYRQEFLVLLPFSQVVAMAGYWIAARWRRRPTSPGGRQWRRGERATAIAALAGLGGLAGVTAVFTGPQANRATIHASGPARVEQGVPFEGALVPAVATMALTVENRNTHRTPLPPHDRVQVAATVTGPSGTVYAVDAAKPMVADPLGRHTTWAGVGFDVWHHGRSGIGTAQLPATRSDVAVFALGDVSVDRQVVARGVPVHVATSERDQGRLELHVGDPAFRLPGIPDGHLRVVWSDYEGGYERSAAYARYAWGGGVLVVLLGLVIAAVRRQERTSAGA